MSETPLKQARSKNAIEAAILNRVLDRDSTLNRRGATGLKHIQGRGSANKGRLSPKQVKHVENSIPSANMHPQLCWMSWRSILVKTHPTDPTLAATALPTRPEENPPTERKLRGIHRKLANFLLISLDFLLIAFYFPLIFLCEFWWQQSGCWVGLHIYTWSISPLCGLQVCSIKRHVYKDISPRKTLASSDLKCSAKLGVKKRVSWKRGLFERV